MAVEIIGTFLLLITFFHLKILVLKRNEQKTLSNTVTFLDGYLVKCISMKKRQKEVCLLSICFILFHDGVAQQIVEKTSSQKLIYWQTNETCFCQDPTIVALATEFGPRHL